MTTVDVSGAANRLLTVGYGGYSAGRNKPGYCLEWVDWAVLQGKSSIGPHAGQYATAYDAWLYSTNRQAIPANEIVPKDMVVVLGPSPTRTDADKNAGDVIISRGDGTYACTDSPTGGGGVIGTCTLAQRTAQTQRPVLGYIPNFCGYDLVTSEDSDSPGGNNVSASIVPDAQSTTIYLASTDNGNRVGIQSPYHLTLLQRFIANTGTDKMLVVEMDICKSYFSAIGAPQSVNVPAPSPLTPADLETIGAAIKPATSLDITLTGTGKVS